MNEMQIGMNQSVESQDIEIDFGRIFRSLLHYAWVVVLLSVIGAVAMYGFSEFVLPPEYQSTASLYIHDKTITSSSNEAYLDEDGQILGYNTIGGNVASYLQNTYRRTLLSDTTLSLVIERLRMGCEIKDLREMISISVKDYPYFDITVTTDDPIKAADIANELADVLHTQVTKIVGGTDLSHVDAAVIPEKKSGPNTLKNMIIGFAAGFVLSCGIIVLVELANNKINNDEYLIRQYGLPVLATITDFEISQRNGSKYYKKYGKNKYYYEQS